MVQTYIAVEPGAKPKNTSDGQTTAVAGFEEDHQESWRTGRALVFLFVAAVGVMFLLSRLCDQLETSISKDEDESLESKSNIVLPMKSFILAQDDPYLGIYIRKRLDQPTNSGVLVSEHNPKQNKFSPSVIIMSYIYKYLTVELQMGGYFVEIGLNNVHESNTLRLEKIYKWEGLVIESNEEFYKALRKTNRQAVTGNICLSTKPYFFYNIETFNFSAECIPLYSILMTINLETGMDFMSIKSGGNEFDILRTLPTDFLIKMLYIDHRNIPNGIQEVKDFLKERKLTLVHHVKEGDIVVGSILVHNSLFSQPF